jgi:hypothetical protein
VRFAEKVKGALLARCPCNPYGRREWERERATVHRAGRGRRQNVLERDPKGRSRRKETESIDLLPTSRATELRSHKSGRGEGNRVQCRG